MAGNAGKSEEAWDLFGDDSDDDSDDQPDVVTTNTIALRMTKTTLDSKNLSQSLSSPPPPSQSGGWRDLLPVDVHPTTGAILSTDVPWTTSAVPAPPADHAPLSNPVTYQSSAVKYVDHLDQEQAKTEGEGGGGGGGGGEVAATINTADAGFIGGGRGYVLNVDVPPGTLLLQERVSIRLPSQMSTYDVGLEHPTVALLYRALAPREEGRDMLTSENVPANNAPMSSFSLSPSPSKSANNVDDLRNLFPKGNDELSENYRLRKEDEFGKDLNRLVDMLLSKRVSKSVPGISAGSMVTVSMEERGSSSVSSSSVTRKKQKQKEKKKLREECFNMLCSIHCNAFMNGLHFHLAMINHSCQPNCVKLGHKDEFGNSISSVWSTRTIKKNEEATISYLRPRMQSYQSRQEKLHRQFDFLCRCPLCREEGLMETNPTKGKTAKHQEREHELEYDLLPWMERTTTPSASTRKETILNKILKGRRSMRRIMESSKSSGGGGGGGDDVLSFSTSMILGRTHKAVAVLCSRLLDEEEEEDPLEEKDFFSLLDDDQVHGGHGHSHGPKLSVRGEVLIMCLESLLSHLELRRLLQGPQAHAEMVDVLSDVANVVQMLLSSSPNHTLLMKRMSRSDVLNDKKFQLTGNVRELITLERITRNVAKTTSSLYVDRWRSCSTPPSSSSSSTSSSKHDLELDMPVCHVVCGPPAAGKTTLARKLWTLLDADLLLDSDVISTRLIEAGLVLSGRNPHDRDSQTYKTTYRDPVYETMYDVVADNVVSHRSERRRRRSGRQRHFVICGPFTAECRDAQWPEKLRERLGGQCRVEVHYVTCDGLVRRSRMVGRNEARDQQKVESDTSWSVHMETASRERPTFPHHFFDNTKEEVVEVN